MKEKTVFETIEIQIESDTKKFTGICFHWQQRAIQQAAATLHQDPLPSLRPPEPSTRCEECSPEQKLSFSSSFCWRNVWLKYSTKALLGLKEYLSDLARNPPELLQVFQENRLQSFVHEQASDVATTDALRPLPDTSSNYSGWM